MIGLLSFMIILNSVKRYKNTLIVYLLTFVLLDTIKKSEFNRGTRLTGAGINESKADD